MPKTDFTKLYKAYYTAKDKPELIHIESAVYLSIEGKGDPSAREYTDKLQALYSVAYAVKFAYKLRNEDFTVPKLEGLWWFDEEQYGHVSMNEAPLLIPRSEWHYRSLIRMPEHIMDIDVQNAKNTVYKKKEMPLVHKVTLYPMHEGKCIQILHTGPFDKEPEALIKLKTFAEDYNFKRNGLHHEIYLSDFRKTAPEKLRTILREPVK